MKSFNQLLKFLKIDIWRIEARSLPGRQSFWLKQLRIIVLAIRGFDENKCQLHASALTFYSLLSIVPVLAMAFGIAKGFGFEAILEEQLYERFSAHAQVIENFVQFASTMLETTKGGVVAGVGVIFLFWSIIQLLGHIEDSFNEIWGVKNPRTLLRKFSDYLSVMLICPILLIVSGSLTVAFTSELTSLTESFYLWGYLSGFIELLLRMLPFIFIWVVFTFIYMFMPNTRVFFRSALMGGIIAGTLYQLGQSVYIYFQVTMTRINVIYGSFAALPLFLLWLQFSWLIVLFGTELSFARQNVHTYEFEPDCLKISRRFKRLLSLYVAHACVKNFVRGQRPWSAQELVDSLNVPVRLVNEIIFELIRAGVLVEVKVNEHTGFNPAMDVNLLTVHKVSEALERYGEDNVPVKNSPELERLSQILDNFGQIINRSPQNRLIRDI